MNMIKIAFIGGGNMSRCIFDGIVKKRGQNDEITVAGPHVEKLEHFKAAGAHVTSDNLEALGRAEVVFLGVKPQILPEVLEQIAKSGQDLSSKLFISMAAGWRLQAFYSRLGQCRLIRIMPNTPSQLGMGVTAMCTGESVTAADKELCLALLEGMGRTVQTDEEGINTLSVLAGSAPAFIYRFMEAMVDQMVKRGFDADLSRTIATEVMRGTASMVEANPDRQIGQLREAVTSRGGTTFQGLGVMTEYRFEEMMHEVVEACLRRTREFEDIYK